MCVPCQVSFFFLLTQWFKFKKCLHLKKMSRKWKEFMQATPEKCWGQAFVDLWSEDGHSKHIKNIGKSWKKCIYLEALSKYELWFAGKKYCWESDNPLLINRYLSKQKVSIFLVSLTCKTVNQTVQSSFIHSLLRTLPSKMTWHLLSIYVFWSVCLPMSQVRLEPRLRNFSLMYDSRKMG